MLKNITLDCPTLGAYMFDGCTALVNIELKSTIRKVETHAFANCTELTNVNLLTNALGEFMFANDSKLTQLVLNPTTVEIPTHAFYRSSLVSISIPSSVEEVGNLAFAYSLALREVDLNACKKIAPYMFFNCIVLQEVTIPAEVGDNVGEYAFANCIGLQNATIHNSKISPYMFYNDELLCGPSTNTSTLYVGANVTSVGEYAFSKTGVYSVEVSSSEISDYMFKDCKNLHELTIGTVAEDGTAQYPTTIGEHSFEGCDYLNTVTLNLVRVGNYMFADCTRLTNLTLGSPITYIGQYAFSNCSSLSNVDTSALVNLETIDTYAFANCSSLDSFKVPDTVKLMNEGIFNGCTSLNTLTIPFVGNKLYDLTTNPETPSATTVFGYIFGRAQADNSTQVTSKFSASGSYVSYIPNSLNNVIVTQENNILYGSFYNCTMLQSINIPTTATTLGNYAFYGCTGLRNFTVPKTITEIGSDVLANCTGLTTATVECKEMGRNMFLNCTNLEIVHLKNVKYVSTSAFEGCVALVTVDLNQGNGSEGTICTTINQKAFYNCYNLSDIVLPDSIVEIGTSAFENCSSLAFITMPNNLTTLNSRAFYNCDSLISIVIPENLVTIDSEVFVGCDQLESILFTNKKVGASMFMGCTAITTIDFQEVTDIAANAFNGCTSLTNLILPKTLKTIGEYAFYNCASVEELLIPESVTSIAPRAFEACSGLLYATVYTRVMGSYMFKDCVNLRNVYFAASTSLAAYGIPSYAFYGCSSLQFPEFPSNITSIGTYAFAKCSSLTSVVIPNTVTTIGRNIFWDVDIEDLSVPFVGYNASPSYYNGYGNYHQYFYSRYTIGWFFGATDAYPNYSSYGRSITIASGQAYSDASKSYRVQVNYYCYMGWGGSTVDGECKIEYWYLPKSLKKVSVTNASIIPYLAFWCATSLTDINIGSTVTTIRESTMYNCRNLQTLTVPFIGTSNGASSVASSSLLLTNGAAYHTGVLGAWFFQYEGGWHNGSYRYVRSNAFDTVSPSRTFVANGRSIAYQIPSTLKTVNILNTRQNTAVGITEGAFYNCVDIENINLDAYVTRLGANSFHNTGISSVEVSNLVSEIGTGAFSSNQRLTKATIFGSIISNSMFKDCPNLSDVELFGQNITIGASAFENCTSLRQMDFARSVISVGEAVFAGCTALDSLYINKLGQYGSSGLVAGSNNFGYLFGTVAKDSMIENRAQSSETAFSTRYLPASIEVYFTGTSLPAYAFAGLSSLSSLYMLEGLTSIGDYAFIDTTNLETVRIPSTLQDCGIYVFQNSGLVTAYFGEGIADIYEGMFADCANLRELIFEATTTTYEYRYVSNNVFAEYRKVGYSGTFIATGNYLCGGPDLAAGTADDITSGVIRSDKFYIDNQDGTFYAYGPDGLLGTEDDILIGIGADNNFETSDDFVIAKIQGRFYRDYLNNTYSTLTIQSSIDGTWNYAFGPTRYGLIDGTLKEVVVDEKDIVYLPISNAKYHLYQVVGNDGVLGTTDDQIIFLGFKSSAITSISDSILYRNVVVSDGKCYVSYNDNTYQEILDPEEGSTLFTLGDIFCAGADEIIGTEDDLAKYGTLTYSQIQANKELLNYGKLTLKGEVYTYIQIITGEDGTHYLYLPLASFINEPSYLGYGKDGKLGTLDDILGITTDFNVLKAEVEQPKEEAVVPQVKTDTYVKYDYTLYNTNVMANTVQRIGHEAFLNCVSLEELTLSSQLEYIGDRAFYNSGLIEIVVPSSVTEIGEYSFAKSNNLVNAVLKCEVLGEYMFSEDKKLKKVSIAYSTKVISKGAFNKCTNLTTVTFHSNYIQDIHYELPNGYYPGGDVPADGTDSGSTDPLPGDPEYITYLVQRAQSSAITLQNGLDGIEGTPDDYYRFGNHFKLIGLDLVAQTVDDIVVLVHENTYYEVIGYGSLYKDINLFREVTYNSTTNSFTYGKYFLGDETGSFSLANKNQVIQVLELAGGNYAYQIGNIVYTYGADGKLGTADDVKTVTIDDVEYVVEEIDGAYYSYLETGVYYHIDVNALTKTLVYRTADGFTDSIMVIQNVYYYINLDHSLQKIVDGTLEEAIYVFHDSELIEVEAKENGSFYQLLSGNFYNRWTYSAGEFASTLICIKDEQELNATYLRGDSTYAIYLSNSIYQVPGDDKILGTEDDAYIIDDRPSESIGGLVFVRREEDGAFYHYHNYNIYYKLDLQSYSYTYVCAGPDGDPTTTEDNNLNVVIGNNGKFYINNHDGTYYAVTGNTLTGTDSDTLVATAGATQIGNDSDYTLAKYGDDFYRDYGDNTYQQISFAASGQYWNSTLSGDRFVGNEYGQVDPTLTPRIVVSIDNGLVYIDHHNGTFTMLGEDGKFNTADDTLHLLMENQKADANDPQVVAGSYVVEGSPTPKTFYYEALGHNVFRKYQILGSYGSYTYEDLGFIAAYRDNKPGDVKDVEAFYSETLKAYYRIDTTSARRGYGEDGMLYGSNRDADSTYIIYNGKDVDVTEIHLDGTIGLYHINGDNTYTKYIELDSPVDGNTHTVEYIVCLGENQQLDSTDDINVVEVEIAGTATRFLHVAGSEVYTAAGEDGLLGYGEDDVLCHLGRNNQIDYTNTGSDDIINVVPGATTTSYYQHVSGNIYRRIENGVLASYVAAGYSNGSYVVGSANDLVAGEGDIVTITSTYVEFKYHNYLLATADGIISLEESQMVHTTDITDTTTYVEVHKGMDNLYYTADDYMVVDGVATFAQEDHLLGSTDDLTDVVAGADEMPYAYDTVKDIYYVFEFNGTKFIEKMVDGQRVAVYSSNIVGDREDVTLTALQQNGATHYYLPNDSNSYYTYTTGSIKQFLLYLGLDDAGAKATLGSIYNYATAGKDTLFVGADGELGTADDITAILGQEDKRAYAYADAAVDKNIYFQFDLATGNYKLNAENEKLMITAGPDRTIGTSDDVDTVIKVNNHYYYTLFGNYYTSPANILGYNDIQMFVGADGEIGTSDDYYNVTRYLPNSVGYKATFVGPDKYYGGGDDLNAILGADLYAYYALVDDIFHKYNNIYQRYAMSASAYTNLYADYICGGANCRPGDADDTTASSGNLVLADNGDWYLTVVENKEYLNKSFDGLLGTADDKHVFVGEDAKLGTYDDYYWISHNNYNRKVHPGQTPFAPGDSDEVKEWKKYHGDDVFFTADDYYSVPSETIVEVDNKVPFELITIDDYAFFECESLEEFQLYSPDDFNTYQNLTTLGSYAFAGCTSLQSIILPYTLQGDKLTSADGTGYGEYIFENCTSLETATFNETYLSHTTFIPKGMFKGCTSLSGLYFHDSLEALDMNVFSSSVTEIREEAFMNTWVSDDANDPVIGKIILSKNLLTIGDKAFYGSDATWVNLEAEEQITFGDDVFAKSKLERIEFKYIRVFPKRIFDDCIYLTTLYTYEDGVKLGENEFATTVERIEEQAFRGTTALKKIFFNKNIDYIANEAFYKTGLEFITIPASLTGVDTEDHLGTNVFESATSLQLATFDYGTVIIRDSMFKNCTSLSELQFYDYPENETDVVATANEGVYEVTFKKNLVTSGTVAALTKNVFATTVSTVEQFAFYNCPLNGMKNGAYTDTYHTIIFTNSLTKLGDSAFAYTDIESITIPSSLEQKNIGKNVFAHCDKLKDIVFENEGLGEQMFIDCTGLTKLILPSGVTSIGPYAFMNCTSLETVIIPKDVLYISEGAFANCIRIEELTLPFIGSERGSTEEEGLFGWIFGSEPIEGITPTRQYYAKDLYKDNYIPETIRRITITDETLVSYGAFYNCGLEYIKLPDVLDEDAILSNVSQLTNIGDYAFYNCLNLDTALIPSQIETIGNYSFAYCKNVVNLAIPQGVTGLGNYAFYHCESLPVITVPSSVDKNQIGTHVFAYCTSLHTLNLENDALGVKMFSNCISLLSVVVPEGVAIIETGTFENCTNLRYVAIPETVETIQEAAFKQCASLEILILPFIGKQRGGTGTQADLFGWIFGLTSETNSNFTNAVSVQQIYGSNAYRTVYMPSTLKQVFITDETVIGYGAFSNCTMLTNIVIAQDLSFYDADQIFDISYDADDTVTGCTLPEQNSTVANGMYIYKDNTYTMPDQTTPLEETELLQVMMNFYSLYVDENIEHIYTYAFSNANGIRRGYLGVTNIADAHYAFNDCTGLLYCYMPNATGTQANNMFAYCTRLERVIVPDTINVLGEAAYRWCLNIQYFQVPYLGRDGNSIISNNNKIRYYQTIGYHFAGQELYRGSDTSYYNSYISSHCTSNYTWENSSYNADGSATTTSGSWTAARYIPKSFKLVVTLDTRITYCAFRNVQSSITELYYSDKLAYVEGHPFSQAFGLGRIGVWDSENHRINPVEAGQARFSNNLKTLSDMSFTDLRSITDFVIPNSVTYIGIDAFLNTGVRKLTIPFVGASRTPSTTGTGGNGLNATLAWYFVSDNNNADAASNRWGGTWVSCPLNNVTLSQYWYSADSRAYVPVNLKTVIVTDCKTIAHQAFRYMSMIETVVLPFGIDPADANPLGIPPQYADDIEWGPNSIVSIGNNAFEGCSLKEIYLPSTLETVGTNVFQNNTTLTKVVSNSSAINTYMFYGCTSLSFVQMDFITEIPDYAFYNNDSLVRFQPTIDGNRNIFEKQIESIGNYAFYGCEKFIYPLDGNEYLTSPIHTIGYFAFSTIAQIGGGEDDIVVHLPLHLQSIGEGAFYNSPNISEAYMYSDIVTMPYEHAYSATSTTYKGMFENVTHLTSLSNLSTLMMERMCMNDINLETIYLPYVILIEDYAFYNCSSLNQATIQSATRIDDYAFYRNTSLVEFEPGAFIDGVLDTNTTSFDTLLTAIGNYAFDGCTILTYPFKTPLGANSKTTSIGSYAFRNCKYLGGVTISTDEETGDPVYTAIQGPIALPISLTNVGSYAFQNDTNVTGITTPAALTTVGDYVFQNCTDNQKITMYGEVSGRGMFRGNTSLVNPQGEDIIIHHLTMIANEMFAECTNLRNVYISKPNASILARGVASIGDFAFYNCKALINDYGQDEYLETIYVPTTVETIGSYAFFGCESIKNIYIEKDSLTTMGAGTFGNCFSLEVLTIPYVGYQQGDNVGSARISLPYSINANSNGAYPTTSYAYATLQFNFYGTASNERTYYNAGTSHVHSCYIPYSLREINVTNETLIANYAFLYLYNVKKITINEGVEFIGQGAFHSCYNLISSAAEDSYMFIIPSTVKTIAADAFYECFTMLDFIVPNTVDTIGVNAFGGCDNLQTLSIPFVGNSRAASTASNNILSYLFYTREHAAGTYNYYTTASNYEVLSHGGEYPIAQPIALANNAMTAKVHSKLYTHFNSEDVAQDIYDEIEMNYNNPNWEPSKAATRWIPKSLISVTVTDADTIYTGAFAYTNIPTITLDTSESLTTIQDFAFYRATFGLGLDADGELNGESHLIIPGTVTTLGRYLTKGSYISDLTVPSSVTSVGQFAFEDTEYLKNVTYASSVLNDYIFRSCARLERFDQVDPSAIDTINTYAFYNCYKLKYFNATEEEIAKEKTIIRIKSTTREVQVMPSPLHHIHLLERLKIQLLFLEL